MKQQEVETWWAGLSAREQKLNQLKYDAVTAALNKANDVLFKLSDAVQHISNSTVQYGLDKRPKEAWNMLVGAQYQFNKDWMIRLEYGFLGERDQLIGGIQYRFGL